MVCAMSKPIALLLFAVACGGAPVPATAPPAAVTPTITQVASPPEGILANAYVVELPAGVVVIDAALRVSDARALRARVDATGKPLLGVLLTHGHPDHYNGAAIVTAGTDAPIIATGEVDAVIRRDDAAKEQQWRGMFGDEWPARRAFPTRLVGDGEAVSLGGATFRARSIGPAESHADSYWTIDGTRAVFVGDLLFSGTHAYVSDGHTGEWLAVLDRLARELPADSTLYPGHGAPGGRELIARQQGYLGALRAEIKKLSPDGAALDDAAKQQLVATMQRHEPSDALVFLVGLGADAVAAEVAAER
jgi:glyoxylase-like metal-dependent hydrolase (beta-lactamase superfamily II)